MKLVPLEAVLHRDEIITIGMPADHYVGSEQFRCVPESDFEQVLLSWAAAYYLRHRREPQEFGFRSGKFDDTPAMLSYDKYDACKAILRVPDLKAWDEEGRLHGYIEINHVEENDDPNDPFADIVEGMKHHGFKAEKYPIYFSLLKVSSSSIPALLWEFPATPYSYKDQRSRHFQDFLPCLELPPDHPHYQEYESQDD